MSEIQIKDKIHRFWRDLGPGLTTGAADDDPSGITTYSQTGAVYGYRLLWTALLTLPFMALVQEMCARIGLVTGRGLAGAIKHHLSAKLLFVCTVLLFVTNTINVAADLGVMAKATELILPNMSFSVLLVLFVVVTMLVEIFATYKKYAQVLKWLAMVLFVYVLGAFAVHVDWALALRDTFLPALRFSKDELILLTAVLGTTISPYLFFWQTSQEVEEQINEGRTTVKARQSLTSAGEIRAMRKDVWSGMVISNIVMFFIIVTCAATLHQAGLTNITDAASAASALRPLAGTGAYLLFTLGIIGTGMLAIPILAGSSSYAITESLGWREGLSKRFGKAEAFYGVIIVSLIVGFVINLFHFDVIRLLIGTAILNG